MYRPRSLDLYNNRRSDSPLTIFTDSYPNRSTASPVGFTASPRRQLSPSRSMELYPKNAPRLTRAPSDLASPSRSMMELYPKHSTRLTRVPSDLTHFRKSPDHRRVLSSYGGSRLSLPKSTDPYLMSATEMSASLNHLIIPVESPTSQIKLNQIFTSDQRLATSSPTPLYKFPFPSSNKMFWMRRMQAQDTSLAFSPGKTIFDTYSVLVFSFSN